MHNYYLCTSRDLLTVRLLVLKVESSSHAVAADQTTLTNSILEFVCIYIYEIDIPIEPLVELTCSRRK